VRLAAGPCLDRASPGKSYSPAAAWEEIWPRPA